MMCAADKFWITELTLIHKNVRSVRNSHAQELTAIIQVLHFIECNMYMLSECELIDTENINISLLSQNMKFVGE